MCFSPNLKAVKTCESGLLNSEVAQVVERIWNTDEVAGASPAFRATKKLVFIMD